MKEFLFSALKAQSGKPFRKVYRLENTENGLKTLSLVRTDASEKRVIARNIECPLELGPILSELRTADANGEAVVTQPARRTESIAGRLGSDFYQVDSRLLAFDVDKAELETPFDSDDPARAAKEIFARFPPSISKSDFIYHVTNSQDDGSHVGRFRFYVIFDEPIKFSDRSKIYKALMSCGPDGFDQSLKSPGRLVFVAAPLILNGEDPVEQRWGIIRGKSRFASLADVKTHIETDKKKKGERKSEGNYYSKSFESALGSIKDRDLGGLGCHEGILSAAIAARKTGINRDYAIVRIKDAVRDAFENGRLKDREESYIKTETSERNLRGVWTWCLKNVEQQAEGKPTLQADWMPDYTPQPKKEISNKMFKVIRKVFQEYFRGRPNKKSLFAVLANPGLGKTEAIIEVLRREQMRADAFRAGNVLVAVPTAEYAKELFERMRDSVDVSLILGRAQNDLCKRPELLALLEDAGIAESAQSVLCRKRTGEACPYLMNCGYMQQFERLGPVVITTHEALREKKITDKLAGWRKRVRLVVCDERPAFSSFVRHIAISEIREHSSELAAFLVDGEAGSDTLRSLDFDYELMRGDSKPLCSPSASDEELATELKRLAEKNRDLKKWGTFYEVALSALRAEVKPRATVSGSHVHIYFKSKGPFDETPMILLDATGTEGIIKSDFPGRDVTVQQYTAPCNVDVMRVGQGASAQFGKQRLLDSEHGVLKDAAFQALGLAVLQGWEKPAVISHKGLVEKAIELMPYAKMMHFNALRGRDTMRDRDGMAIIGRTMPSAQDVETEARLRFPDRKIESAGYIEMVDPKSGALVMAHPDPTVNEVLYSLCGAEIDQAIGRLRAVQRPGKPIPVLLLSSAYIATPSRVVEPKLPTPQTSKVMIRYRTPQAVPKAKQLFTDNAGLFGSGEAARCWRKKWVPGLYKYIYSTGTRFEAAPKPAEEPYKDVGQTPTYEPWPGAPQIVVDKVNAHIRKYGMGFDKLPKRTLWWTDNKGKNGVEQGKPGGRSADDGVLDSA